jgi:hypothetical protein
MNEAIPSQNLRTRLFIVGYLNSGDSAIRGFIFTRRVLLGFHVLGICATSTVQGPDPKIKEKGSNTTASQPKTPHSTDNAVVIPIPISLCNCILVNMFPCPSIVCGSPSHRLRHRMDKSSSSQTWHTITNSLDKGHKAERTKRCRI